MEFIILNNAQALQYQVLMNLELMETSLMEHV